MIVFVIVDHWCPLHQWQTTVVVDDTDGKFVAGVIETGGKFYTSVTDAGDKH
jgi:hypothetical protein